MKTKDGEKTTTALAPTGGPHFLESVIGRTDTQVEAEEDGRAMSGGTVLKAGGKKLSGMKVDPGIHMKTQDSDTMSYVHGSTRWTTLPS